MRLSARPLLSLLLSLAFAGAALPAAAQMAPSVVVNGRTVTFAQPPVERAGRIFVPLRGVFEQLGAGVVYQNGLINATGNGRTVSLRIGSTRATVDGRPQTIDSPPFIIGATTLVPLRFISQALGATVRWDENARTAYINGGGRNAGPGPGAGRPPMGSGRFTLLDERPSGFSLSDRPAIHASFSRPVRASSVRVTIDGTLVRNGAMVTANAFDLTVRNRLSPGTHTVNVSGVAQNGAPFSASWTFRVR